MRAVAACICITVVVVACASEAGSPGTSTGHDPYPYTTPTPPQEPTPIDGIYVRTVTADVVGGAGPCRRCPPYRLAVGEDILGLEDGVFEVFHRGSGYLAVGHYSVEGSTVTFFNDPNCPQDRGRYRSSSADSLLSFTAIDDSCAYDNVRVRFLSSVPWRRIEPPEGIFTSVEGHLLVLLDGEFVLERAGQRTRGTTTRTDNLITFAAPACRQDLAWSADNGSLTLNIIEPVCEEAWVRALVATTWIGVG